VSEVCQPNTDPAAWAWLGPRALYAFETLDTPASYESISHRLDALEGGPAHRAGRLFYLATPPDAMAAIVLRLGVAGLLKEGPETWRRVVFEKPFGHDLASALELNRQLALELAETQIYRIDHYLGKETVQNVMALRFGNGLFEPVWNRRCIDHVQITVAETVGVEGRGGYYDRSGALRDMVQSHLFQLLALHRHGAAHLAVGGGGEGRAGEGAPRHPSVHRGRRAVGCRARTVRPGHVRQQASPWLPSGAEGASLVGH